MSAKRQFAVVALRQETAFLNYWEAAIKGFVTPKPSKRKAAAPYFHWRQIDGKGYTIWISQAGYSSKDRCNLVRIEMAPPDSTEGQPVFDGLVQLSLAEFHTNSVLDSGTC